jgi:flavin reductase (DIM6/NTAB) family NADH-FMN oxidoreductase RutF
MSSSTQNKKAVAAPGSTTMITPADLPRRDVASLLLGLVAPRPIAWVSTIGADGTPNLAPFSFFNAFSSAPPTIGIGPGSRLGVNKDTLANVKATGELVVNMVSRELAVTANQTSGEFSRDVDEWEVGDLTRVASDDVRPPRIAESPAALECRVHTIVDLGPVDQPTNSLIIARVTRMHVREDVLDGYRVRPEVIDLVGRLGGDLWCGTEELFELERPSTADPDDVRANPPQTRAPEDPAR